MGGQVQSRFFRESFPLDLKEKAILGPADVDDLVDDFEAGRRAFADIENVLWVVAPVVH